MGIISVILCYFSCAFAIVQLMLNNSNSSREQRTPMHFSQSRERCARISHGSNPLDSMGDAMRVYDIL